MSVAKIDKDRPLPPNPLRRPHSKIVARMVVGDSVFVSDPYERNIVRQAMRSRNFGYACRREGVGWRLWRTEDQPRRDATDPLQVAISSGVFREWFLSSLVDKPPAPVNFDGYSATCLLIVCDGTTSDVVLGRYDYGEGHWHCPLEAGYRVVMWSAISFPFEASIVQAFKNDQRNDAARTDDDRLF